MSALLLGAAALLIVVAALVVVTARGRGERAPDDSAATLRAARRHEDATALVSLLGVMAAPVLLVAGSTTSLVHLGPSPGLLSALSLTIGALIFLAVHHVGELTWPRPQGQLRQATLRRRTVGELTGRRGHALLATCVLAVVALVLFGLTATDTGRAVPRLITADDAAAGVVGGSSGPYPGWAYGVPLLGAFAVVLVATWLVLRLVARRPAVTGVDISDDLALRLTSTARILAGVQLFLGGTLAAVLLVAMQSLQSAGWVLAAVIALAVAAVVGIGSLVAAPTAMPPVGADAASRAGEAARTAGAVGTAGVPRTPASPADPATR